ncbi:hypothetical protein Hdeb2414_s0004g00148891 [Helianthus debilis subsp. tardiflorus]
MEREVAPYRDAAGRAVHFYPKPETRPEFKATRTGTSEYLKTRTRETRTRPTRTLNGSVIGYFFQAKNPNNPTRKTRNTKPEKNPNIYWFFPYKSV